MSILIAVSAMIVLIGTWVATHGDRMRRDMQSRELWSEIEIELQRRLDLMPSTWHQPLQTGR